MRRLQGLRRLRGTRLRRARLRRRALRRRALRRGALCRRPLRRRGALRPLPMRRGRGRLRRLWLQLLGLHGNVLVMVHRGLDLGLLMGK